MGQVEKKSIHTKIIVGAGAVLLVLNLLDPVSFFAKKNKEEQATQGNSTSQVSQVNSNANPSISWFDKFFCRGRSAASFCSNAVIHPKASEIELRESSRPSPEDESIEAYSFSKKNL